MAVCPTSHVLRIETDEQWEQSAVSSGWLSNALTELGGTGALIGKSFAVDII